MDAITMTVVLTGTLLRYDPGVMEGVMRNHVENWGHYSQTVPLTQALTVCPCCYLGKRMGMILPDGRVLGPLWATDCVADQDAWDKWDRGIIGEASWELSEEIAIPLGRYFLPRDGPLNEVRIALWPGEQAPAPCWPPARRPETPPKKKPSYRPGLQPR